MRVNLGSGKRTPFFSNRFGILGLAAVLGMALTSQAQTEKILHAFTGTPGGSMPNSGVIFDSAGNLYGATLQGGNPNSCLGSGCGVIYELSAAADGSWQEAELFHFRTTATGASPLGNVMFDASGNLYGAVYAGGGAYACYQGNIDGCGLIFKLSPASPEWRESVPRAFNLGIGGGIPNGGLVADASGNLYGTTQEGGNFNNDCSEEGCGVVFKLSPTSSGEWKETALHTFTDGWDGAFPGGPLIFDAAGNLYGTAELGGTGNGCACGVVFELSPTSSGLWKEAVLYNFSGNADGSYPDTELTFDGAGNLYGSTFEGGDLDGCKGRGCGVAFELSPISNGGWKESVLHTFTGGTDGSYPGELTLDDAGNVYGTTTEGGALNCGFDRTGCGVVFELSPGSNGIWYETVLYTFFGGADGGAPSSGLTLDANGNLYGTTRNGGILKACDFGYGCGVVYEIIP
jgi:hypothetical protein